jgi:dTDP-4-dehydrorhamnose reductase
VKVLVLGANGMIGHVMFRVLSQYQDWMVFGTERTPAALPEHSAIISKNLLAGIDLTCADALTKLFAHVKPEVVVNCAGLTKHLPDSGDPLKALPINSLLPHRLADLCLLSNARLIHVSTDCVFSGEKGNYLETDRPDAIDVYGKSKELGEVKDRDAITLRTSTIGHELNSHYGLLEWFLLQSTCKGYNKAIFSGLPSVEFARVVRDVVIPNKALKGLYQVGASPIDKNTLLNMIAAQYGKKVDIIPDDLVQIDRSLNTNLFKSATGYVAPSWPTLIEMMHQFKI